MLARNRSPKGFSLMYLLAWSRRRAGVRSLLSCSPRFWFACSPEKYTGVRLRWRVHCHAWLNSRCGAALQGDRSCSLSPHFCSSSFDSTPNSAIGQLEGTAVSACKGVDLFIRTSVKNKGGGQLGEWRLVYLEWLVTRARNESRNKQMNIN